MAWTARGTRTIFVVMWCLSGLAACVTGGCWRYRPASPILQNTPASVIAFPTIQWPPRDPAVVAPLLEKTPDHIAMSMWHPWQIPATPSDGTGNSPDDAIAIVPLKSIEAMAMLEPGWTITHKGMYGPGLLRLHTRDPDQPGTKTHTKRSVWDNPITFEPTGGIVTSRTIIHPRSARQFELARARVDADIEARKRADFRVIPRTEFLDLRLAGGLPIRIPPEDCSGSRGVVLHMHSLAGNPFEPAVLKEFESQGWAVVHIGTQTTVVTPVSPENEAKAAEIEKDLLRRYTDARATQLTRMLASDSKSWKSGDQVPWPIDVDRITAKLNKLLAGEFSACPGTDLNALGAQIATEVDDALAGNAYAAEVLVEYIRQHRADLAGKPIVVVGFSAGALATPAVVARLEQTAPGAVKAVVLIGGAADLFTAAQESSLTDGGIRVRCNDQKVDRATLAAIRESYLRASQLDPYALAPALGSRLPVLQVHAELDGWVPAKCGELLTKRLGHPDRLLLFGGHQVLFYTLPSQATRIADWIDGHVPKT